MMRTEDILILERARSALQAHHDWHMALTDPEIIEGVEIIPVEAYSESWLCERTLASLSEIEINRRTRMRDRIKGIMEKSE